MKIVLIKLQINKNISPIFILLAIVLCLKMYKSIYVCGIYKKKIYLYLYRIYVFDTIYSIKIGKKGFVKIFN